MAFPQVQRLEYRSEVHLSVALARLRRRPLSRILHNEVGLGDQARS